VCPAFTVELLAGRRAHHRAHAAGVVEQDHLGELGCPVEQDVLDLQRALDAGHGVDAALEDKQRLVAIRGDRHPRMRGGDGFRHQTQRFGVQRGQAFQHSVCSSRSDP
jgi:hypothetical protein